MKLNFTFSFLFTLLIIQLSFPINSIAQRDNLKDRIIRNNPPDERVKRVGKEEKKDKDIIKGRDSNPVVKERAPQPPATEIIIEQPVVEVFHVVEVVPAGRCGRDVRRPEIEYKKPNYKSEGIKKYNEEDYWGALANLNIAIEETPDDYELYFYRGMVELKIKLFEDAKEDFDIFLEYNFYEPEAYFQRGLAKFFLIERLKALEDFKIAAEMGDKRAVSIIKRFYN